MGVLFDTRILIDLERGSIDLDQLIRHRENEPFGTSVITVAELLHGVHRADTEKRQLARAAYVEKIIESFPVYPLDLGAARIYARVWATLAKKGITIGAHDLIIGSTAISLGFSVITSDLRDYSKIKGLKVESVSSA